MNKFMTHLFMILNVLLAVLPAVSSTSVPTASPIPTPRCHEDEQSALLEFKHDFRYPVRLPDHPEISRKLDSWKLNGGQGNCCAWDGVECDAESGHVVGLELCCTGLQVAINSSSTLFRLVHLRKLNLGHNSFNDSQLPSALGDFRELTSLNLSNCDLTGQIPHRILDLTNLSSLDLSGNYNLQLIRPSLGDLLRSLNILEELDLSAINISSSLLDIPANLSSLKSLHLSYCGLHGRVPSSIFPMHLLSLDLFGNAELELVSPSDLGNLLRSLTKLEELDLSWVKIESLEQVHINSSSLRLLVLQECGMQGFIPSSLFNLPNLEVLDMSINFLSGPLPKFLPNSMLKSLFLSDNQFSAVIPASIGNLSSLKVLQVSGNSFSGHFPELPTNSRLRSLYLVGNRFSGKIPASFGNISSLKVLYLSSNSFGHLPKFSSSSRLKSLYVEENNLKGDIPASMGNVSSLEVLDMSDNSLSGNLPEFASNSQLKSLLLQRNNLSGEISASIGNAHSLQVLHLSLNSFSGEIPASIGNLYSLQSLDLSVNFFEGEIPPSIGNLTQLTELELSSNRFQGIIPSFADGTQLQSISIRHNQLNGLPLSLGNLARLRSLDLSYNNLTGEIPSQFWNLSQLNSCDLSNNHLSGEIPPSVGNLTQLITLDLSRNTLQGPIPSFAEGSRLLSLTLSNNQLTGSLPLSFGNLARLSYLHLSTNSLTGQFPSQLWNLSQLEVLDLSNNNLSILATESNFTATLPLTELDLFSCNLHSFPTFLRKLDMLVTLDLSSNSIAGEVPTWFQDVARENLQYLYLSSNSLTGFAGNNPVLRWTNLRSLDLGSNKLQGPLPIPPESINSYRASNNALSGEIPLLICNRSSMDALDLGNNQLTGVIPCFANLTKKPSLLILHGNKLHGVIPELPGENICSLEILDLHNNQLGGPLPKSLSRCSELTYLNLGANIIEDAFPSWLGVIHTLTVLILRSNKFHGSIVDSKVDSDFPGLHIIDLSSNNFEGPLPAEYFKFWVSMRMPNVGAGQNDTYGEGPYYILQAYYGFTMTITFKGIDVDYQRINNDLRLIDISSNKFSGEIPNSTASLTGLHSINFSNNFLSGRIPPSLATLRNLEVLDLSKNKLYGEIPEQLTDLTFLEVFDVSSNNLSGHIPQGKQFGSFKNTSYEGNPGLCGVPLSRTCGPLVPPSSANQKGPKNDMDGSVIIEWKAVAMGYAGAFVIAAVIGNRIITVRPTPYIEALGLIQRIRWVVIRVSLTTKE